MLTSLLLTFAVTLRFLLLLRLLPPPTDNGARIHSNSWGANVNAYTVPTTQVDEFMAQRDDMLILFAAGNSGADGPGSIGAPATCKNCLTVGASENNDPASAAGPLQDGNMAVFSSQGPSIGARYKPDIAAPGFFVSSSNSNSEGDCPITEMAGTSMATPVTAGNTALVRQYFREGFWPAGAKGSGNPILLSGAGMKALMIHSGQELTGTYQDKPLTPPPSNLQGFGRIQLDHILFPQKSSATGNKAPSDRMILVDDASKPINPGEEHSYQVGVSTSPDPLLGTTVKVTLVWTDAPGESMATNPLINNLDLTVDGMPGNGRPDSANTVEQVITQATGAPITVKVKGTAVPQGPQKYALVITGPLDNPSPPPMPKQARPPPPPYPPGGGPDGGGIGTTTVLFVVALAFGYWKMSSKEEETGQNANVDLPPPASSSASLPQGWRKMADASSGASYYHNSETGATQWTVPTE